MSGGSVDYIDVLLGAEDFVDFIDRFSAVNTLIEADRENHAYPRRR
ncbi:coiled-coil domain-containing protein [Planococcus sp. MB-3u-03]